MINELHSTDIYGSYGLTIYFPATFAAFNKNPDHTAYLDRNTDMTVGIVPFNSLDNWLQEYYTH